ncbi:MAG TPA: hypothetical protein VGI98_04285 [Candidatus Limnocylindrales bacterium]|jgi:hypothetical protein
MSDQNPIRVYGWNWGQEDNRPQIPWIGVFLVILGGLLVLKQVPGYSNLGSGIVVLAAGLAFLVVWLIRRSTFALYAGALLTAAAVPDVVQGLDAAAVATGFGTVCYGVAFLFIALVRGVTRGGWGWQLIVGLVLLALGVSEMAVPNVESLALPLLLIVLGLALLARRR